MAVVVLGVFLALGVFMLTRSSDGDWKTFKDDASGITIRHPLDWSVQTFGPYCRRIGPGLLVSNVGAHTFRNVDIPNGCTNQWKLGGLPDTFVLVDVSHFSFPPRLAKEVDTELPLELDRFARSPRLSHYAHEYVVRGRFRYTVRVWTGRFASPNTEKALARVIGSIRVSDPRT